MKHGAEYKQSME